MPTFEITERRIISADNEYVTADMVKLCVESEIVSAEVGEIFTAMMRSEKGKGKAVNVSCRVIKANEVAVRKLTS